MVMSIPVTRTDLLGLEPVSDRGPSTLRHFGSFCDDRLDADGGAQDARHGEDSLRRGAFDLVRRFVEQRVDSGGGALLEDQLTSDLIDWEAVEAAAAPAHSLEQAVGHALLLALSKNRPVSKDPGRFEAPRPHTLESGDCPGWSVKTDDPFFSFSVADIVPDFGDESRYRSKVARRMARVIGIGKRSDEA